MKSKASHGPVKLFLYTKPGCHLCDRVRIMLAAIDPPLTVEEMDISISERMTKNFGERIPVLQRSDSSAQLDWPFNAEQLVRFVEEP